MAIYGSDKLDIFRVFAETFRFFFKKFGSLAGISLILLLTILTNKMGPSMFVRILLLAVTSLITIWVKAALINAVAAQYQGEHFAYSKMIKEVNGKYPRILGTVLLLEVVLLIPALCIPLREAIFDRASGPAMTLLSLAVTFLLLAAIVLFTYLYIKFIFVVPCAVLEGKNTSCFRISRRLVKGNSWRVLSGLVAFGVIVNAIPLFLSFIMSGWSTGNVILPTTGMALYFSINLGNYTAPEQILALRNIILPAYDAFVTLPLEIVFITLLYLRSRDLLLDRLAMENSEEEGTGEGEYDSGNEEELAPWA